MTFLLQAETPHPLGLLLPQKQSMQPVLISLMSVYLVSIGGFLVFLCLSLQVEYKLSAF